MLKVLQNDYISAVIVCTLICSISYCSSSLFTVNAVIVESSLHKFTRSTFGFTQDVIPVLLRKGLLLLKPVQQSANILSLYTTSLYSVLDFTQKNREKPNVDSIKQCVFQVPVGGTRSCS